MHASILIVGVVIGLGCAVEPAAAVTKSFRPAADNTLVESELDLSNGAGDALFAGRVSNGSLRRGLVRFNVADSIPAGATVTAVTLRLRMTKTLVAAQPVALHRALVSWGEGGSISTGGGGRGAAATANDATWMHRFFPGTFWATPGGDFAPVASASIAVAGVANYTWNSTTQLVADVQAWVDDPAANHGWVLVGNEVAVSAKRFSSKENNIAGDRPLLTVEFSTNTGVEPVAPLVLRLHPAVPNPFNPRTRLGFSMPQAGRARITVFDARGAKVAQLFDGMEASGDHTVEWDGRDARGLLVGSGVYVVHLEAGGERRTWRVVLAK